MAHRSQSDLRAPEHGRSALAHPWVVSATDLVFLWDDCPRCFYRKVALGRSRPAGAFPSVFGRIDRAMKQALQGHRVEQLLAGAPPGVITEPDRWVRSAPLRAPGVTRPLVIRGRLDALVACDDGTMAMVDFKTTGPDIANQDLYSRQLHAYATTLEHPGAGDAVTVSALGLGCFTPITFHIAAGEGSLRGEARWVEVPLERVGFAEFLTEVVGLLGAEAPPPPAPGCGWCRYRGAGTHAAVA